MKKMFILTFLSFMFYFSISSASSPLPDNIIELQPLIEQSLDLKNYPLERNIPYSSLDKVFNKYCSPDTMKEALLESEQKYSLIKDVLNTNSQARSLFFKRYKKIILDIETNDTEMFCKEKVIGYSLLKKIQHEKIHNTTEINKQALSAKANKNTKTQQIKSTTNQATSPSLPSTDVSKEKKVETWLFTWKKIWPRELTFDHDKEPLKSPSEIKLGENIEQSIYKTLDLLLSKQLLNWDEIKLFNQKIKIHYTTKCQPLRGNFQLINNDDWSRSPKGIELLVSLCKPLPEVKSLERQLQHILTHELGHYIYFFRDKTTEKFNTICRNDEQNTCTKRDFYSNYSQENKEEDYAESFAFWVSQLDNKNSEKEHSSAQSQWIMQKEEYFNTLYKHLNN